MADFAARTYQLWRFSISVLFDLCRKSLFYQSGGLDRGRRSDKGGMRFGRFRKQKDCVDYAKIYKGRTTLLRRAYERSNINENSAFHRFCEEQSGWLEDYALFMAVKTGLVESPGANGRRISVFVGSMHWIITAESCILRLNSRNICSFNSGSSGKTESLCQ